MLKMRAKVNVLYKLRVGSNLFRYLDQEAHAHNDTIIVAVDTNNILVWPQNFILAELFLV